MRRIFHIRHCNIVGIPALFVAILDEEVIFSIQGNYPVRLYYRKNLQVDSVFIASPATKIYWEMDRINWIRCTIKPDVTWH
ncbi:MAG: hypothetical protein HWD58_16305 [Bacteroidota bacterium]|nr:MAG: hypothetical protein HWD58_16305 [Bacteroidota bacterium]